MAVQLGPIFNLGQRATSRVESAHSVLKSYFKISVLNLAKIVQKLMLIWKHILSEHRIEKARNADIQLVVNEQLKRFIAPVQGLVPNTALTIIISEILRHQNHADDFPTNALGPSFGLLSSEQLLSLINSGEPLSLQHFHPHWQPNLQEHLEVPSQDQDVSGNNNNLVERLTTTVKQSMAISAEQQDYLKQQLSSLLGELPTVPQPPVYVDLGEDLLKLAITIRLSLLLEIRHLLNYLLDVQEVDLQKRKNSVLYF
ncbi:hypothetical protein GEMRC1_009590 [Eukaryota sp. GEM-RC1]